MRMVDRAEKNPGRVALGLEDETLLLSSFRKAMAEYPSLEGETVSAAEVVPPAAEAGGIE